MNANRKIVTSLFLLQSIILLYRVEYCRQCSMEWEELVVHYKRGKEVLVPLFVLVVFSASYCQLPTKFGEKRLQSICKECKLCMSHKIVLFQQFCSYSATNSGNQCLDNTTSELKGRVKSYHFTGFFGK